MLDKLINTAKESQAPVPTIVTVSGPKLTDMKTIKVTPDGHVSVIEGGIY